MGIIITHVRINPCSDGPVWSLPAIVHLEVRSLRSGKILEEGQQQLSGLGISRVFLGIKKLLAIDLQKISTDTNNIRDELRKLDSNPIHDPCAPIRCLKC